LRRAKGVGDRHIDGVAAAGDQHAAHARHVVAGVEGGLGRPGLLIVEADVVVHQVADGLHARPAGRRALEQGPGDFAEAISLAIAAAQQVDDRLIGQVLHRVLLRVGRVFVDQAGVADDEIGRQRQAAGRRQQAADDVAEAVEVLNHIEGRIGAQPIRRFQVVAAGGVDAQRQQHRRGGWTVIDDLEAGQQAHGSPVSDHERSVQWVRS
jgi:hypothetical protein